MPNIENARKARIFNSHLLTVATRRRVNALTLAAEQARSVRAIGEVNAIADKLLECTPYRLSSVGLYYKSIAQNDNGLGSPESTAMFSALTESSLPAIRGRANLALSVQALFAKDYSLALRRYEAARRETSFGNDPIGTLHLGDLHAAILSEQGKHQEAATELQNLASIARLTRHNLQALLYNAWNSLAIEMLYLGQVEAAKKISRAVVASPYTPMYSEWVDTRDQADKAAAPKAVVVSLASYRQKQATQADDFLQSQMGKLFTHSQRADEDTKRFIHKSIAVLLQHAALKARPPTSRS